MDNENKNEQTVTISIEEYNQLIDDQMFLEALTAYGVDNWCGYSDARKYFEELNE